MDIANCVENDFQGAWSRNYPKYACCPRSSALDMSHGCACHTYTCARGIRDIVFDLRALVRSVSGPLAIRQKPPGCCRQAGKQAERTTAICDTAASAPHNSSFAVIILPWVLLGGNSGDGPNRLAEASVAFDRGGQFKTMASKTRHGGQEAGVKRKAGFF